MGYLYKIEAALLKYFNNFVEYKVGEEYKLGSMVLSVSFTNFAIYTF